MCPILSAPALAPPKRAYRGAVVGEGGDDGGAGGLDHVGLVVSDMSRSVRWYREVLGLRRAHEGLGDFPAVLEANGSGVALFPNEDGGPIPVDDPMRHVGFRTSRRGLEAAKAELRARGSRYHEDDYGVAWSVYLPDPDGYWSRSPPTSRRRPERTARSWAAARGSTAASWSCGRSRMRSATGCSPWRRWLSTSGPGWPGRTCRPPGLAAGLLAVAGGLAAWQLPGPPPSLALPGRRGRPGAATGSSGASTRPSRTSGSSTSTSPRGRSSGRSAWPG